MTDRVAQNALYLTIASVGQKIIAFVYFLFVARVMMPEQTGVYFLALSVTTIFSVVAEFGITSVTTREIAREPSRARFLIRQALALKIPFLLLAVVAALLTGRLLDYSPHMQLLIGLASLVLVIDALQVFFYGVLRGFQELQYEAAGIFSGMITTATVGGIVLWLVPSLPLLILALLAGSSVNLLVSAGRVIQRIGWHAVLPHWSTKEAKSLLAMAFPFALAAVFVKMYSYIDSIFISKFLDITAVGIYAIAYKYTYAFQFLPLSFIAALYPGMSAVVGKDESTLKDVFMRSLWYMAFLCVPIVFGLFAVATEAIGLAGEGYEASVPVFRVLIFVLIPIFLDFPIGALLNAAGRQSSKTAIMGMTMVINVLLNLLLIPQMGILGAAYAALASFIFMLLAGLWLVPSVIPTFSFLELFRRTVPVYVVGMIMFIVVVALKPMVGWLPVIAVGAIVYLGGLMLLGSITWNDLRYFRRV